LSGRRALLLTGMAEGLGAAIAETFAPSAWTHAMDFRPFSERF